LNLTGFRGKIQNQKVRLQVRMRIPAPAAGKTEVCLMAGHRFEVKDRFYLDGKPFRILSGSIHYFRVVPEYWRDRLEKLRAMGCNTVETYIPWNLHEPRRGEFRFGGGLDFASFLKTAQELGLWAIVRPSPYICAEWEFGGLPAWLLAEDGMRLRCSYPPFLDAVRRYYRALFRVLAPLQVDRGGPVLLMQVENEYGAYGSDKSYLEALRAEMRRDGVTVPLVTSDGPWNGYMKNGSLPGALITANFGSKPRLRLPVLKKHVRGGPLMCMEFWDGWFDAWGGGHHTKPAAACAGDLDAALAEGCSVNLYMFHGGTDFGFMNGSNYEDRLSPDVTSYDYDAPLTEDGEITPKYLAFRKVIGKYAALPPMDFSRKIERRSYGEQKVTGRVSLFSALGGISSPAESPRPLSMEKLGQSYGYILYRSTLCPSEKITGIRLTGANDRAQVFLDGKRLLTLYDRELQRECAVRPAAGGARIDILVENMGRVNYGPELEHQRKGIDGEVLLNGRSHTGWKMYPLPMDTAAVSKLDFSKGYQKGGPAFYRVPFEVENRGDTFLDLSGWGKGCALLNGFNLGRFWEIGPQKRLYIPAPLLREGENELILFETEGRASDHVLLCGEPALG